jgi:NADPH:quinone reductase-like Zn-dependent oxidoreductase
LNPGDWISQNAANSGVGREVIASARKRGIRKVYLVRRAELIDELLAAGEDTVLLDSNDAPKLIQEGTGNAPIRLAFDGVSGPATARLVAIVSSGSTIVSCSAKSYAPMSINSLDVIFKRITARGFLLNDFDFALAVRPAI